MTVQIIIYMEKQFAHPAERSGFRKIESRIRQTKPASPPQITAKTILPARYWRNESFIVSNVTSCTANADIRSNDRDHFIQSHKMSKNTSDDHLISPHRDDSHENPEHDSQCNLHIGLRGMSDMSGNKCLYILFRNTPYAFPGPEP